MRETSEARNDFLVPLGVPKITGEHLLAAGRSRPRQAGEQFDRLMLVLQRFGMFQRKVMKNPLDGPQPQVKAARNAVLAIHPGVCIKSKSARRVAMDIARELVCQQYQRQQSCWRPLPSDQFVSACKFYLGAELRAQVVVDRG